MPSDISEDEWGEIQRFGQRLHEEQMKKQKVAHESRVKQMRDVLDQQVKLRNEIREKTLVEKQEYDRIMVDQAKKELEVERKQKAELQQKVIQ